MMNNSKQTLIMTMISLKRTLARLPLTLVFLLLTLAIAGTALAADISFLTSDNSTFTTTIGDWSPRGGSSWVASPFHTASGSAKTTSSDGSFDFIGYMASGCYDIDYASWPETEKPITFSGYVKNRSTAGIVRIFVFYHGAGCPVALVQAPVVK